MLPKAGWVVIPLQVPAVQPAIIEVLPCTGRTTRTREGTQGCEHQDRTDGEIRR
jgi:hypothetical protein